MLQKNWYTFSNLHPDQLYALLRLRSEVFIVEQNCAFLDTDGKDQEALHLLGTDDNKLVAYLRLFPPNETENHLVFGRLVVAQECRSKGYAKQIMQELLDYAGKISQAHQYTVRHSYIYKNSTKASNLQHTALSMMKTVFRILLWNILTLSLQWALTHRIKYLCCRTCGRKSMPKSKTAKHTGNWIACSRIWNFGYKLFNTVICYVAQFVSRC